MTKQRKSISKKQHCRESRKKEAILLVAPESNEKIPNENEPYLMLLSDEECDNVDNRNLNNPVQSSPTLKCAVLKSQLICFTVLSMFWSIRYCFGFGIHVLHARFIKKYFLWLYFVFVALMCIGKGILKSYARKLDGFRVGNVATSFEYLCEFYCNALYWILFRQFIVCHAVFDESVYTFVIIVCAHLSMELFSFCGRMSDFYFDNTNDLLHEFQQRQDCFHSWLYNTYNDDSNIYQWRTRLSFDFVARFNICVTSAIIQQIYLLFMIPIRIAAAVNDTDRDRMFAKATVYNSSAVCAEIFLYLMTMLVVRKLYWINIWQSFENMIGQTMGHQIVFFYWLICIVSIY